MVADLHGSRSCRSGMETAVDSSTSRGCGSECDWRSFMKAWLSVVVMVCAMTVGPAAVGNDQDKPATTKPGATGTPKDTKAAKPTISADSAFMRTAAMDGI